jgi:hypothetical protein
MKVIHTTLQDTLLAQQNTTSNPALNKALHVR